MDKTDSTQSKEYWDTPVLRPDLLPDSAYSGMIDKLRGFLDNLAGAGLDEATATSLGHDLQGWSERLQALQVNDAGRMFARVPDVPGHGQVLTPAFWIDHQDGTTLRARVSFGSFHYGVNEAAHGGAIALLFDEILGLLANESVSTMARTAFLHVNYRSITPIGRQLQVSGRVSSVEGRKIFIQGELRDGNRLCADAEGLFVALLPGQQ